MTGDDGTPADGGVLARSEEAVTRIARQGPPPATVNRVGLGGLILLAGLHKLVAPGDWGQYLAPSLAALWPVPLEATMVVAGVTELPFGLALVLDRYTTLSAVIVALSLLGTSVGLAVLVLETGRGGDVLVRDLGLFAFAAGVTVASLREE